MTLVEVLVAIGIGLVIISAAFGAITVATTVQTRTADRLDAVQRGRLSMERITRGIRSQQCISKSGDAAVELAAPYAMQFYSSVAKYEPGAQRMERRRLEWKPKPATTTTPGFDDETVVVGNITETIWQSSTTAYPYAFPASPTSISIVAEDVEPELNKPIFNYYKYDIVGGVGRPSSTPLSMSTGKVIDDFLDKIVMVDIRFKSRPRRAKNVKSFTVPFFNRVSVRTADPTDPENSPLCTE